MGKGDSFLFWHNTSCGPTPLAIAFLEVYSLANLKFGLVADHIDMENDHLAWDLHLRRVNDWELSSLSSLIICLDRVGLGGSTEEDSRCWQPCSSGFYSIKSMFNILQWP